MLLEIIGAATAFLVNIGVLAYFGKRQVAKLDLISDKINALITSDATQRQEIRTNAILMGKFENRLDAEREKIQNLEVRVSILEKKM